MPTRSKPDSRKGSVSYDTTVALNKLLGVGIPVSYRLENLSAGADITARAFWRAPAAGSVSAAFFLNEAASAGIDVSNTAVVTLRNITASADIATITLTANTTANTATALTLGTATLAADDIVGIVVTQGAAADLGIINLQFTYSGAGGSDTIADLNGNVIA